MAASEPITIRTADGTEDFCSLTAHVAEDGRKNTAGAGKRSGRATVCHSQEASYGVPHSDVRSGHRRVGTVEITMKLISRKC
jgi:hypothetical protein